MDVVKAMPQFAWPAFTERRYDLHLVVAHVPAGICEDPAALMKLLIERLQPEGDFALSCEQAGSETVLFCAFERASDASVIIDALCARLRLGVDLDDRNQDAGEVHQRSAKIRSPGSVWHGRGAPQFIATASGQLRPPSPCRSSNGIRLPSPDADCPRDRKERR